MLARMFNYESRELVAYRNMPGKLIIFYDDLERDSPRVASTLYERGYDNVYVLTGGTSRDASSHSQTIQPPFQVCDHSIDPIRMA